MTTDTSTRLLTEDELEVVSGGMIAQKEGIDKSIEQGAAGLDPFNLDHWLPKGSV